MEGKSKETKFRGWHPLSPHPPYWTHQTWMQFLIPFSFKKFQLKPTNWMWNVLVNAWRGVPSSFGSVRFGKRVILPITILFNQHVFYWIRLAWAQKRERCEQHGRNDSFLVALRAVNEHGTPRLLPHHLATCW